MQDIFIQKPYRFVPPMRGRFFPSLIRDGEWFRGHLRRNEGVIEYECRHVERLRQSIERGDSVLVTPNHSRTADPVVLGWLAKEARCLFYGMASWHLFHQGWLNRMAIRALGGFSVNREGLDRQALDLAIRILETGERPLIIFPEGTASRTNDRLLALLDGPAFIARTAAKRRKRSGRGPVVVHPVAIKYVFGGDIRATVTPVLEQIEDRLTWQKQDHLPLLTRIGKIGLALLSLKEQEYFNSIQSGDAYERQERLINRLLTPLENEWLGGIQKGGVVARIKQLRMKLLPDMIKGKLDERERERRWRQLADTYLAQQVSSYPRDYFTQHPSVDRILETVERLEEDLSDRVRIHGQLKVIIHVDNAIEVPMRRERKSDTDPLMAEIGSRLQGLLDELSQESRVYHEPQSDQLAGPESA